jgi:hypothetical protein
MPDRWWFLRIKESNVRIASFFELFETTSEMAPANGPMIVDAWLSASEGDAGGLWLASLFGDLLFPKMFTWGEYAAIGTQDAWAVDRYYAAGGDPGSILGNPGTDFAWGGGRLADAWPTGPDAARYRQMRTSQVETLLVGGQLDVSTPPQVATKELLPYLPHGRQVVLAGFGHSGSFWSDQPEAGTRLVNAFLDTGRVDDSLYRRQKVDFAPGMTHAAIAKILLGVMLGLSALAVLSLLWMALRVRWQGSFGRKSSVVLRAVYPIVLGVGGWLLGALVVLTTAPESLDDDVLAALSVGLPIGRASTSPGSTAVVPVRQGDRARGGAAAHSSAGGSGSRDGRPRRARHDDRRRDRRRNLILLVLDIAWDGQAADRSIARPRRWSRALSPCEARRHRRLAELAHIPARGSALHESVHVRRRVRPVVAGDVDVAGAERPRLPDSASYVRRQTHPCRS